MTSVSDGEAKQRKDRPAIRRRFVNRAKTLLGDPKFRETIETVRGGWNEDYPSYSISQTEWIPRSLSANVLAVCLPPKIEMAIRSAKANEEEVPEVVRIAVSRWTDGVLVLCDLFWPPAFYPNWLGYPLHPASIFVSASLVWKRESIDAIGPDDLIVYGNLRPRPVGYDPFDHWNTPGAAYWRTYAETLAEAIEDVITRGVVPTEDWRNGLKQDAVRTGFKAHNDRIAAAPEHLHWVFSPFPGLTGTDRDDLMASMLEAITDRFGVDPVRGYAIALANQGMNANQIAKLLGVDQKTIVAWMKAA